MTTPQSSPLWSAGTPPKLLASREKRTKVIRFPPLPPTSPLAAQYETIPLVGVGRLCSFSTIHPNPRSGIEAFTVGYVDMEGPVRVFGRMRAGQISVGALCRVVQDEPGGYAFEIHSERS